MAITQSVLLWDLIQRDGRRYIREQHTDNVGLLHFIDYLAGALADASAAMAARASVIAALIAQAELEANLADVLARGALATPTLKYNTFTQAGAFLRAFYATSTRLDKLMVASYLNTLTNAQLQSLFSMTVSQANALRTRLQTAVALLADVNAQVGE